MHLYGGHVLDNDPQNLQYNSFSSDFFQECNQSAKTPTKEKKN